ncbi:NAD(P)/FAD-dependent oxidoreductase [Nocardioides sp.]|uniref:NAD(P)/FAD-dependent oxidoreductase n=1 Tax=Nocardioides sp. TaxID=35761 RepID=UPI003784B179
MARVVVLGAGISGHTAALHLRRKLGKEHEVVVVSPNADYNWIPSNIWVGVGRMTTKQVTFPLAPVYRRKKIDFRQAKAVAIWPEGSGDSDRPAVEVEYTLAGRAGETEKIDYDFLINATGPKLNFAATPGLGPDGGHSLSVCTADHARETAARFAEVIAKLEAGQRQRLVIGVGHGMCTCEGAAFEYAFNVEHELRTRGLRDRAEVVYLTNEHELGDFGVGGMTFEQSGFVTSSQLWTESLFREPQVKAVVGAHVQRVEEGKVFYETLQGEEGVLEFDFAMLLPPFKGQDLRAFDRAGQDISDALFAPNGFLKVDADYTPKPYEEWKAADWPSTYANPSYPNVFGVGIAFAPPHQISKPRKAANGTVITPAPPRTGMPSGLMGRQVAFSIADMIQKGAAAPTHTASMSSMGAACVASAGAGVFKGTAASMTMFPVVPDNEAYPEHGRSLKDTTGEIGLAGHWVKHFLHYMFIYKAKARPGWSLIPE